MSDVGRKFLVGTSEFDKVIRKKPLFVDKTLFIKEFIESSDEVTVIIRPRRFGKSTNLSMLKSFLSFGALPESFTDFAISKDAKFVETHCGKYPVVLVDFKDCNRNDWKETFNKVWLAIREMVLRHREELKTELLEVKQMGLDYENFILVPSESVLISSLKWLIDALYRKYKQEVIVLIDEYDAAINHAFRKKFYSEASSFFGNFYSSALKSNSCLGKACLVGIVELRGEGVFSGMNSFNVYSVADEQFSLFFGFTEDEIRDLAGPDIEKVIKHYNGYKIGSQKLINPWSFIKWYHRRQFKSYWIETSIDTLYTIISKDVKSVLKTIVKFAVVKNHRHKIQELKTAVKYKKKNWSKKSIWHFLILTGYLTYERKVDSSEGFASIPNEEIRSHWLSEMKEIMEDIIDPVYLKDLRKASTTMSPHLLEAVMKKMVLNPSCHDLCLEISYHMFFFGAFCGILHDGRKRFVTSNKEAGHGRYDVVIEFRSKKKAIIFEFKKSKHESDLDRDAEIGLEQILSKNYSADFPSEYKVLAIGVAFFSKQISALKWKILSNSRKDIAKRQVSASEDEQESEVQEEESRVQEKEESRKKSSDSISRKKFKNK